MAALGGVALAVASKKPENLTLEELTSIKSKASISKVVSLWQRFCNYIAGSHKGDAQRAFFIFATNKHTDEQRCGAFKELMQYTASNSQNMFKVKVEPESWKVTLILDLNQAGEASNEHMFKVVLNMPADKQWMMSLCKQEERAEFAEAIFHSCVPSDKGNSEARLESFCLMQSMLLPQHVRRMSVTMNSANKVCLVLFNENGKPIDEMTLKLGESRKQRFCNEVVRLYKAELRQQARTPTSTRRMDVRQSKYSDSKDPATRVLTEEVMRTRHLLRKEGQLIDLENKEQDEKVEQLLSLCLSKQQRFLLSIFAGQSVCCRTNVWESGTSVLGEDGEEKRPITITQLPSGVLQIDVNYSKHSTAPDMILCGLGVDYCKSIDCNMTFLISKKQVICTRFDLTKVPLPTQQLPRNQLPA
ncbi:MAG: hypothetical protein ACPGUD_01925 [Parashewanella sp.]